MEGIKIEFYQDQNNWLYRIELVGVFESTSNPFTSLREAFNSMTQVLDEDIIRLYDSPNTWANRDFSDLSVNGDFE